MYGDPKTAGTTARQYAATLARIAGAPPTLDLAHLGLGPEVHTAYMVPGDSAVLGDPIGRHGDRPSSQDQAPAMGYNRQHGCWGYTRLDTTSRHANCRTLGRRLGSGRDGLVAVSSSA